MHSKQGGTVGKYLFEAKYSPEGAKGLMRDGGSGRRAIVEKAATSCGGRVESFYFAFGGVDAFVIMDLPDNTTAAAMALAVNQGGAASVKTVVLMTASEVDEATKKAIAYKPPGA